jgi:ParB/RepB/Spo0J family partition protein
MVIRQTTLEVLHAPAGQLRHIPIDAIRPAPTNARRASWDVEALASSIRLVGILEPLLVQGTAAPYTLIAGERRWRAAQLAGLELLPCLVLEVSDEQRTILSAVENLQREDLDPIEEAELFRQLSVFMTQGKIGELIGKSQAYVSNTMRLLGLPAAIQQQIHEGKLTRMHGLEVLREPAADRTRVARVMERNRVPAKRLQEQHKIERAQRQPQLVPPVEHSSVDVQAVSAAAGSPVPARSNPTGANPPRPKADAATPSGADDRREVLRIITRAQGAIDALLHAIYPSLVPAAVTQRRTQIIDDLDWAKGLVDPLRAEPYEVERHAAAVIA